MTGIIVFDFESNPLRILQIDGAPWFAAADVCRNSGHPNPTMALRALDPHQKRKVDLGSLTSNEGTLTSSEGIRSPLGGNPNLMFVSEGGLYKLSMRSKQAVTPGTAQHRFANFVVDELLPTLRRDGVYSLPSADCADLAAKRAFYSTLSEPHRALAEKRVKALRQVAALMAEGARVGVAVRAVAEALGLSVRTVYNWKCTTYMVPKSDWPAAMAPRWSKPRGMRVECHPDGLRFWLDLTSAPAKITVSYDRYVAVCTANSWFPIPPIHAMRRAAKRAKQHGRALA